MISLGTAIFPSTRLVYNSPQLTILRSLISHQDRGFTLWTGELKAPHGSQATLEELALTK